MAVVQQYSNHKNHKDENSLRDRLSKPIRSATYEKSLEGEKSIFRIMCGFLMINNPLRDKDGRIVKRGGKGPRVTE